MCFSYPVLYLFVLLSRFPLQDSLDRRLVWRNAGAMAFDALDPIAPTREKADIISDFINDHAYGLASTREVEGTFRVQVVVQIPVTQELILSVRVYGLHSPCLRRFAQWVGLYSSAKGVIESNQFTWTYNRETVEMAQKSEMWSSVT